MQTTTSTGRVIATTVTANVNQSMEITFTSSVNGTTHTEIYNGSVDIESYNQKQPKNWNDILK